MTRSKKSGNILAYINRDSPVHRTAGFVKLIVFLLWSVLAMTGFDTPVMLSQCALGFVLFAVSKIKLGEVAFILKMLIVFMLLNLAAIYVFAPEQGVAMYGTRHVIWTGHGRWTLTAEQLFYEFNIFLKYFIVVPPALLLIVTSSPSSFASSLNKAGVPYSGAWVVSLTLRYIPDVQRDYTEISQAQQARGLELSKKASPLSRLKGAARIVLPLIFTSLQRIDVISAALELRGFGKHRKRTWYADKPITKVDIAVLITAVLLFAAGMWATFNDGSRFWNPWK